MKLSRKEILVILEALSERYGPGYAPGEVGALQAKLSMMLEVAT